MASDYIQSRELVHAMQRHEAGSARVIPVILAPVDWQQAPFAKLQALPEGGKPLTEWPNLDAGYADAARGIRRVVERLRGPVTRG
jgi:hypothetical protein